MTFGMRIFVSYLKNINNQILENFGHSKTQDLENYFKNIYLET
jgi:hypothetical protein